jgi:outer membrane protein
MRTTLLRSKVLQVFGLALLALSGALRAQIQVDTTVNPAPEAPPVEVRDGAVTLSLQEAVEIALRQNIGLLIQRYTRSEARLAVDQTLGIYDTLANATGVASDVASPTVSTIAGSQTNRQVFNFGFDQVIPTGGRFSLGWDNSRSEEVNNPTTLFNPRYNSSLSFTFRQPLLRDFGRLPTERQILLARSRNLGSRDELERQVNLVTQQVINTYWDLVEAREQLLVAQQSLDLAKELHERNRIQVEVGTLAPLELVQSEAAIATREEDIIRSQGSVGDAEDALRRLLNLPQGALWQAEIKPSTAPEAEKVTIDLDQAIQTALVERPEIRAQQQLIEQARLDWSYSSNQLRPALDLTLDYGLSGVGGTLIERDRATGEILRTFPGGFSDAFSQVGGFDFSGWTATLVFGFPLQNRTARAQLASDRLEHERTQAQLQDVQQAIITEVRQTARRVDTSLKSIDAARASVRFQERSLEAERKRYENGMSSSFEITRIQDDLTQARSREVSAVVAYRRAVADFQRATGQLLDNQGIALDDPEQPIDRFQFRLFGRR